MVTLIQGPLWFLQVGAGIELLSAAIVGVVAATLFKFYHVSRDYKWLRLGGSFALLAAALCAHGVLMLGILAKQVALSSGGVLTLGISLGLLRSTLFFVAVYLAEVALLVGLFLLFTSYHETSLTLHGLVIFLFLLVLYFAADSFFVLHLFALILSLLITTSLIARYLKRKHQATKLLAACFGVVAASKVLFLLVLLSPLFVVLGAIVQLIGFVLLLLAFFACEVLCKEEVVLISLRICSLP